MGRAHSVINANGLMEVTWRSEAIVMSFDENKPISASAHAFLAFLGHLLFSMGNIKVAR